MSSIPTTSTTINKHWSIANSAQSPSQHGQMQTMPTQPIPSQQALPINSGKSTMITLFKPNQSKISASGLVQIDQQSYQSQPVTLTILNSPSIPTSNATICLSSNQQYANLVMKSQPSIPVSIQDGCVVETGTSTAQAHCSNVVSTVVVASSASDSHNAVQYLVPAVQNIYMSPSGFSIPISGEYCLLLKCFCQI